MLILTKHRSSLNVGGVTLTIQELCSFTNEKKCSSFRLCSLTLVCIFCRSRVMLHCNGFSRLNVIYVYNSYYHKIQFKFKFWSIWTHIPFI